MSDVLAVVDAYFSMWNEPDPHQRASVIARAWSPTGQYVDPILEATGHTALHQMVDGLQARYPGHRFRRLSGIDQHHKQLRFSWDLVSPEGVTVVVGLDVATLAEDGRLLHVSGFFGPLPAHEEVPHA